MGLDQALSHKENRMKNTSCDVTGSRKVCRQSSCKRQQIDDSKSFLMAAMELTVEKPIMDHKIAWFTSSM